MYVVIIVLCTGVYRYVCNLFGEHVSRLYDFCVLIFFGKIDNLIFNEVHIYTIVDLCVGHYKF